jgi:hypothetical protein
LKLKSTLIMKKGTIILSAAAFGATIVSAFAFKPANSRHKLFVSYITALGGKLCVQCNAWTLTGTGRATFPSCVTSAGGKVAIPGAAGNRPLYTSKTVGGVKCKNPFVKYTLVN